MGAPDGGQELVTRRVSSSAGRPPTWCWAATARFFLMVALLAVGCALLVASYAPRPVTAVWVGGVSHGSHFSAGEPLNTTQQFCEALCTSSVSLLK